MWLSDIEADRLRNLKTVRLELPPGLTVIAGRNGQGKTSLLEAIFLLSTGRSFRTRQLDDLVGWTGGPLRVAGTVNTRVSRSRLGVLVDRGVRRLVADGHEQELEDHLGRLDAVDLTGERMKVLRGGPDERRRFLDRGVVGLRPDYLRALSDYRRVLQQRNALLREARRSMGAERRAELEAWEDRLVRSGERLHRERRQFAVRLAAALGPAGRALFPSGEELCLGYRPSPELAGDTDAGRFATSFREALERGRPADIGLGHTAVGPHRDDLSVELDGVDLRRFGSAGQVRAAMVALKLGKLSLLREERGETPVFLMDDFDSDLDEARTMALAVFLRSGGFQVVVATSKEGMADRLGVEFLKVRMEDGAAHGA